MTAEEIDLTAWHADGHKLNLGLNLFNGRDRNYGQVAVAIECPEDSVCHRWYAAHHADTSHHCFVEMEREAMGSLDFLDGDFATQALPDNWSRWAGDFPIEIEWRDLGEDGVEWRPVNTQAEPEKVISLKATA